MMRKLLLLMIVILMTAAYPAFAEDAEYGNPQLLVEVDWLAEHLEDEELAIIDLRPQEDYLAGHIPGALQLDLADTRAVVDGVRGQVADADTIAGILGGLGIANNMTIIIYDNTSNLDAARLFWTLEYYGHEDVRLLNGTWAAWKAADQPISTDAPDIEATEYTVTLVEEKGVNAEWVLEHLGDKGLLLVDARNPAEYAGEEVRAERGGHIPGAFNMDWHNNLNEDGFFKSQEELEELYASQNPDDAEFIVAYCQTGHRASVAYFTLRLMGYENVAVYDGSWEEWGNRADLPFETEA